MTDNERNWRRLFAEATDERERSFYEELHRDYPDLTVSFDEPSGDWTIHGIGLRA
jgi:hypothetical protein